jgi:mitogen-activated protein kinase organizer 1
VGGDRSVLLWDVASAKVLKRFGGTAGHSARINCVAFAGVEDSLIISGSFDASARIWDTRSNSYKPVQILTEAKDSVSCLLAGSSCGVGREAEIITGSTDGRVRCYDVRMGRVTTDVLGEPVTSLCATHDGEALLVGTLYGKNRLIDRRNGGCLQTYTSTPSEYRIKSCLGGKGDRWVLSGTENGEVVPGI